MRFYKKLNKDEVQSLPVNSLVYVTSECDNLTRTPAFTMGMSGESGFSFVTGQTLDAINSHVYLLSAYGYGWHIEIENGFTVDTPDGVLHAIDSGGDEDYPGIRIDLHRDGNDIPISLSMTEYIPGGEGVYGYDPAHPAQMQDEFDEVPLERIVDEKGESIASKSEVTTHSGHTVSAGLVSRAWPDEAHNEAYHKRVFHIGYRD